MGRLEQSYCLGSLLESRARTTAPARGKEPGRRRSWRRHEGPCAALREGEGEKAGCVSGPQQGHWARAGMVLAGWVWAVVGVPACGEEGVYEYASMHMCECVHVHMCAYTRVGMCGVCTQVHM